jgi:hypothetical protein
MINFLLHLGFAHIIRSFQIVKNNDNSEGVVTAIDGISLREIEEKHEITLSSQDIAYLTEIKRAVLT